MFYENLKTGVGSICTFCQLLTTVCRPFAWARLRYLEFPSQSASSQDSRSDLSFGTDSDRRYED
jgi:hypothetical protein